MKYNREKFLVMMEILIKIIIIIAVVEFSIMYTLLWIAEDLSPFAEALLDTVLLAVISTPLIYKYVVSPFVSEHENILDKITHMAYHDPLTGLANRQLLVEYFHSCSLENDEKAAILSLDLDAFKEINDLYGHDAGDCILVEVSKRLTNITRTTDLVSRIGGDEFLILVKKFDGTRKIVETNALTFANKIISALKTPILYEGKQLLINVSIGVHVYDSVETDFDTIVKHSDTAMYKFKEFGKGRATIFSL